MLMGDNSLCLCGAQELEGTETPTIVLLTRPGKITLLFPFPAGISILLNYFEQYGQTGR